MTNLPGRIGIVLLLSMALAILLSPMAANNQAVQSWNSQSVSRSVEHVNDKLADVNHVMVDHMLQVWPTVMPTYAPTPAPSLSYVPKGYGLPMNPRLTPTPAPSGGATYSHEYGLPYHPINTATPAPSGGATYSHEYGLPYHPAYTPTPALSGGAVPVQKYEQSYNPRVYPTPVPPSTLPPKTNIYHTPAELSQPHITNPSRR